MNAKPIIKIILFISFLFTGLVATENDNNIFTIKSKDLYLSYKEYPKRVFTYQKFTVKLESIILLDPSKYDTIVTTFTKEQGIEVLTKDVVWIKQKQNKYTASVTYKIQNDHFLLPKITFACIKDEEVIAHISIKSPDIIFNKIAINERLFSNIIASDLIIESVKTKQYTNDILHTTIHIKAKDSNLENTHFNNIKEQNIVSLTNKKQLQSLFYSIMIPTYTKQIDFTYYNTTLSKFIKIQMPMILDTDLVSTQTELNPYNSSLLVYKQILTGSFLLFLIILYLFTKKNFYLFLISVNIIILAYFFIPNKRLIVDSNTKVYILPSSNSTVYEILRNKTLVEIINENKQFLKVLFKNDNIGWIKKNDIR